MLINNKMKQHAQGNWGSDKWTKEHTKVKVPEDVDVVKYTKVKKNKEPRKAYIYPGNLCPHCLNELPEDTAKKQKYSWCGYNRVRVCPKCHAYEVDNCPACKNSTWYSPRSEWYKHQGFIGCGFEGKLLTKRKKML
jgi:hypothetical protein